MIINISDAKAKLIDMANQGEEVIIAKNNLPLVKLLSFRLKPQRRLGLRKGRIDISNDFLEEDEEINDLFYGSR